MIPKEILDVLEKFNWTNVDTMGELLTECLKEHGPNGLQSCLEVALGC